MNSDETSWWKISIDQYEKDYDFVEVEEDHEEKSLIDQIIGVQPMTANTGSVFKLKFKKFQLFKI